MKATYKQVKTVTLVMDYSEALKFVEIHSDKYIDGTLDGVTATIVDAISLGEWE